jgi:hypothetical protein
LLRQRRPWKLHGAPPNLSKPTFALGFLTGQEMDWLPEAMNT